MKKLLTMAFIFFSVCFSGCVIVNLMDVNTVRPEGKQEEYKISVREFNSIRINGHCNVIYYSAPSDTITLKVHPNLLQYYEISIVNNELIINTTKRINYNYSDTATLMVSVPELKSLIIDGFGGGFGSLNSFTTMDKINTDSFSLIIRSAGNGKIELDVDEFIADISGACDMEFTGKAYSANIKLAGAGEMNAFSLQTRSSTVNFSGTGTIRLNCTDNLNVNASGVGTVEYTGSPNLNLNTSGVVNVRKVN